MCLSMCVCLEDVYEVWGSLGEVEGRLNAHIHANTHTHTRTHTHALTHTHAHTTSDPNDHFPQTVTRDLLTSFCLRGVR